MISWYSVTSAEYKAASASEKTDDKIFYLTDTQQIYRGTKNYTENVVMYTTIPTSPATGKLYINSDTKECRIYDGTNWITIVNPSTIDNAVQYGHAFYHGTDWRKSLYNADIDDYFASARLKYNVSAIYYDMGTEEENAKSLTSAEIDRMFDGNYDSNFTIPKGKTLKITFNGFSMTYPYGFYMVRCYPVAAYVDKDNRWPTSISCSIYSKNGNTDYTWKELTRTTLDGYSSDNTNERAAFYNYGTYNSSQLQFIIEGKADYQVGVSEIEMWSFRYSTSQKAFVSKYGPQKLYYELTAPSFKGDLNGTAAKATADADGNVISTTYEKKEATLLASDSNLTNVVNEGRYYATSGNTISNKPEGVDSFYLEVKKIKDTAILKYVLWEENSGMPYTRNRIINLTKNLTEDNRNLLSFKDATDPVTKNGVTMTNNGDGTFTVNGTNSTNAYMAFVLDTFSFNKKGFYFLSGFPNRTAISNIYTQVLLKKGSTQVREAKDYGTGVNVLTTDIDFDTMTLQVGIAPNATLNNVIIKPYFASWCSDWVRGATTADNVDVENSLTSDSTTSALAAAQGKALDEKISAIVNNDVSITDPDTGGFFAGGATKLIKVQTGANTYDDVTIKGISIGKKAQGWDEDTIAIGNDTSMAEHGIGIGTNAQGRCGVAIGKDTYTYSGVAIGEGAKTPDSEIGGTSIGVNAKSGGGGFAGGYNAKAQSSLPEGVSESNRAYIDAIQLGTGENNVAKTFQVYNYRLMNADGTIPEERMTSKVSVEEGKSLIDENVASNLSYDDTDSAIKSLKPVEVSSTTSGVATTEKTTKVDGSGIATTSVSKMGSSVMSSNNAVYSSSSIALNDSNNEAIISIDSSTRQIKVIHSDGTQNTTVAGGSINTVKLNNAAIGDLSELVDTNTTLVAIIKGLQEQVASLGTTVGELQTRLKTKSLLYISNGRSDVPSTYEQLSYLESTGTQYIDTGLKINNIFGCDIKYQSTGKANSSYGLDGVIGCNGAVNVTDGSNCDLKIWFSYGQYGTCILTLFRSSAGIRFRRDISSLDDYYATIHHVQWKTDGTVWYNGENVIQLDGPYEARDNYNIYAFAANSATSASNKFYSKTRMYYLKFCAQDGTLLRDFVPCKRISDGVLGMYDVVSDTFFTNKGTGTFLYESL